MQTWLNDLKLAIIEEDVDSISSLIDNIPELQKDKLKQVKALIDEALALMERKKEALATEIKKMQRAREYLKN